MSKRWFDFGPVPSLPYGFRIAQVCTFEGTGNGDDTWAWALQHYKPVKHRRLFKTWTEHQWVTIETGKTWSNPPRLPEQERARFIFLARHIAKSKQS